MIDIRDMRALGSFDEIAEWIEENPEALWRNAFPDTAMPNDFRIRNVQIDRVYEKISFSYEGTQFVRGFRGTIRFSLAAPLSVEDAASMFVNSGIVIHPNISYGVTTEASLNRAVELNLWTHYLRFTMLADEWVSLAVMEVLREA